ncbi:alpha/beta fold hydrolase [Shewanella sp. 3_MG-2023]|uniref:alpha/beta hydrolase n=1 Tax=Shewanella sp. 3_MG-2023 TaxID=3062635 RepID=UPI0026E2E414|nr:alpha/beta fold hydrolase [Shewanella sp. 3_MG-2023]MDO6775626.1 alpha/beta fold hydrolase [Shewanella sp. 3_MG-2023]
MTVKRLEVSPINFYGDNFDTITAYSSHLNGRGDISVYRQTTKSTNVSIIILLHGVYGSHWVWSQLGGVEQVYTNLRQKGLSEFVLVMPSDGGHYEGSGYLPFNHADYEAWIVEDVISAVIDTLPMCSDKSKIYICGLSMGGYGALRLGAKYPKVFSGISAHSSITNIEDFTEFVDRETLNSLQQTTDIYGGDVFTTLNENHSTLAPLRLDCGKEDPLFTANSRLVRQLIMANIDHTFEIFDGGHSWEYWHQHVVKTFEFFAHIEKSNNA